MKTMIDDRELLERAQAVRKQAHAPYSDYRVGAAIVDENDNVHVGCNVENSSYPEGNCAAISIGLLHSINSCCFR